MFFSIFSKSNHVGILILILTNGVLFINGFNLETRLPLVKHGPNKGSYFGYSVAAHQIRNEIDKKISEGLILVGAPLDQNRQPGTKKSGALWRCPLNANECTQVITDGLRDENRIYRYKNTSNIDDIKLNPPMSDEIKEGQWLGGTVKSQGPGQKVLVCAHRYVHISNLNYHPNGLCYILKQDLTFEKNYEPCQSLGGDHTSYGSCQSGTSGTIFGDENIVVMGAPGALNWRGAITILNMPRDDDDIWSSSRRVFTGPNDKWTEMPSDSYLGMSVTGGYFFGDNTSAFAVGAPHGNNETGQVVLFAKMHSAAVTDDEWKRHSFVNGEQIASNFGYQLASADLNGDKLTDLIVAAPFYFNSKAEEGGAVYVYMNDPVRHLSQNYAVKLTGKPESRFGLALSSLGDINRDGCEDLAIGAPYEGNGVVYIYLGSRNGLITKPSQIIKSEMVFRSPFNYTTFGYSLSGGVDLDQNGYPDLVIGAYENDTVVLLRSRPIIGFTTKVQPQYNLTNFDPTVRNCLINNTHSIACFSFETCCTVTSVLSYENRNLSIEYHLEAETFVEKTSRIWFDDFNTKDHIIKKKLRISNSETLCQRHTAYLKENTLDIQKPIQIRMSYKLIHKEPERVSGSSFPSLNEYPILNQQEADKTFVATFLTDCGSINECKSQLFLSANLSLDRSNPAEPNSNYVLALGEMKKLVMNVSVSNAGESAYQARLYVQLPKEVTFNQAFLIDKKDRDICHLPVNDTYIVCDLGNPLKQSKRVDLQIEFGLENVNGSSQLLEFNVTANTKSNDLNKQFNNLKLQVDVVEKVELSISGESRPEEIPEMRNTELKGELAMRYFDEVGSQVIHSYTILNKGSWGINNLRVEFEWPHQVNNNKPEGKWLLYLEDYPVIENVNGNCVISNKDVNPLKYITRPEEQKINVSTKNMFPSGDKSSFNEKTDSSSGAQHNRVKRDVEVVVRAETFEKDGRKYSIVKMNCILGTVKCLRFSCELDLIESGQYAKIIIKSRLWDATLIEDYGEIDEIRISSRAKMHIPENKITLKNQYSNEHQIDTKARVNIHGKQTPAPIPILFIILAILIGLLLFILLTLILWKLGFFKRRRPDPTLSGNLEKHKLDDS